MSDEEEYNQFETFELPPDAFPFTLNILDKNGNIVDSIRVVEPGVLAVSGNYPTENGPYTCKVVCDLLEEKDTLQKVAMSIASGWLE